jgi:outer membrane protein OmpA-like peptidoglycan-associated protein
MKTSKFAALLTAVLMLPIGLFARYGNGLGGEYKSSFIPLGQQSGWDVRAFVEAPMKKAASAVKKEAPKAVVQAAKPADTDGDGVIDDKDECPGTAAGTRVEASGCPAAVKAIEDNWVLKGVNFETSSDKIKTESYGVLNDAAEVLKARSKVRVEIQGHTDNMGDDKMNLDLSTRRAASVKNYLVGKGVSAGQLETKGFGESAPVADNNTTAGRAQNRRIEFKVLSR